MKTLPDYAHKTPYFYNMTFDCPWRSRCADLDWLIDDIIKGLNLPSSAMCLFPKENKVFEAPFLSLVWREDAREENTLKCASARHIANMSASKKNMSASKN